MFLGEAKGSGKAAGKTLSGRPTLGNVWYKVSSTTFKNVYIRLSKVAIFEPAREKIDSSSYQNRLKIILEILSLEHAKGLTVVIN